MIESVGIIGAGQMGSGIAQVCAVAGLSVTLVDADAGQLTKAIEQIGHFTQRQVDRFMTRCIERDIELIVTTEKDAVKLRKFENEFGDANVYYAPIEVGFEEKENFEKQILNYVRANKRNS